MIWLIGEVLWILLYTQGLVARDYHISRKFSTEWYPIPAFPSIRSVQKDCRFSNYPSLLPFETNGIKSVVKIFLFSWGYWTWSPRVSAIFCLQNGLPGAQKKTWYDNELSNSVALIWEWHQLSNFVVLVYEWEGEQWIREMKG